MKTLIFICLFLLVRNSFSMSEKQMKSTANMVRQVCQPKTKATNAQIDNMHKGEFEEAQQPKCYMKCVFETLKMMKNAKFEYDSTIKQVVTLPQKYMEPTQTTADKCRNAVKSSDPCEAAYELAKCWYFSNPEYYFFP